MRYNTPCVFFSELVSIHRLLFALMTNRLAELLDNDVLVHNSLTNALSEFVWGVPDSGVFVIAEVTLILKLCLSSDTLPLVDSFSDYRLICFNTHVTTFSLKATSSGGLIPAALDILLNLESFNNSDKIAT